MRKHKEIVKAWLDNEELVVFFRVRNASEWSICESPNWLDSNCYFAALPQHKEACLHWLNGGDVISANMDVRDGPINAYKGRWSAECYFMNKFHNLKIKPRKEKRWIAVHKSQAKAEVFYKENIIDNCLSEPMYEGYQKFEIEVEV